MTWIVLTDEPPLRRLVLGRVDAGFHAMRAVIVTEPDGRTVVVDFEHRHSPYFAQAEAARALAIVLDTIGDFQLTRDPFHCNPPTLDYARLTLTGDDARVALVGVFGDAYAHRMYG